MAYEPDSTYGEVTKPSKEQEAYTASHAMTRDEFIKKYALGEGGTFVADDKGGNAASEVAGQNVADYYDTYLSKDAKQTQTLRGVEGDTREAPMDWGQGRYSNTHPYFDGYDNVNPHPESNRGNGLDEAWKAVRPLAAIGAMAYGGWAMSGAGAIAGAAASGGSAATGLAGTLGMNAGIGATALNAGALNTGISLLQGNNIGDSLKSGATAAALSPVGGWAKGAIGSATAGLGSGISGALSSVGAGAATGAAGAALTGLDIGKGAITGALSGAASEAGKYVGGVVKESTNGSEFSGKTASTLTNTAIKGGTLQGAAGSLLGSYAGAEAKETTGSDMVANVAEGAVSSAVTGKKNNLKASLVNGAIKDFTNPMGSVTRYLGGWTKAA